MTSVYALTSAHPEDIDALLDDCGPHDFFDLLTSTPRLFTTVEGAKAAAQAEADTFHNDLEPDEQAGHDPKLVWKRTGDRTWVGETKDFYFEVGPVEVYS